MKAAGVKAALRNRHPAVVRNGSSAWPGAWTCLEEWMNIDLLAVSAWAGVRPYPRYARIGYEVKVSRSDYKRELARPGKRAAAVAFCHEFYFAIPRGLLKPEEIAWTPPTGFDREWTPFDRPPCPGFAGYACDRGRARRGWSRRATRRRFDYANDRRVSGPCPTCRGTGYLTESPVVRAGAPRLWVPADVGLLLVEENGKTIVEKKAPRRKPGPTAARFDAIELSDAQLADLVRWTSVRPDPRHVGLRDVGVPPEEGVSSSH